jgi:hypothetical protein
MRFEIVYCFSLDKVFLILIVGKIDTEALSALSQICVWCWHHIMDIAEKDDTEGRCPACRSPYDKEKIVGMAANCERWLFLKQYICCWRKLILAFVLLF